MYRVVGIDGKQYGPITAEQVRRWLTENRVNSQTLHSSKEPRIGNHWLLSPSSQLIFQNCAPDGRAPPAGLRGSSGWKQNRCGHLRDTAWVIRDPQIHPRYTGAGLIMLLVTLLTCFIASPIMHLIGLIEGIIYLTKSDADFVKIYVEGRRDGSDP